MASLLLVNWLELGYQEYSWDPVSTLIHQHRTLFVPRLPGTDQDLLEDLQSHKSASTFVQDSSLAYARANSQIGGAFDCGLFNFSGHHNHLSKTDRSSWSWILKTMSTAPLLVCQVWNIFRFSKKLWDWMFKNGGCRRAGRLKGPLRARYDKAHKELPHVQHMWSREKCHLSLQMYSEYSAYRRQLPGASMTAECRKGRLWYQMWLRELAQHRWCSLSNIWPARARLATSIFFNNLPTIHKKHHRNHLRLVVGGGGDLTTSIFLLEGVDFMLNIDVYSRFDPDRDPAVMAMMRMMREGGIGSDTGDISVQSYLYGDAGWFGCFGLNGAAYCRIRVWWGWSLGFECLEQKFTWTLIRSQVKSILAILMSSSSLKLCQVSNYVL